MIIYVPFFAQWLQHAGDRGLLRVALLACEPDSARGAGQDLTTVPRFRSGSGSLVGGRCLVICIELYWKIKGAMWVILLAVTQRGFSLIRL